jgi:NAD(P)-dependent dehydrogenase (short-subunit alcohol dehydrogenase family)
MENFTMTWRIMGRSPVISMRPSPITSASSRSFFNGNWPRRTNRRLVSTLGLCANVAEEARLNQFKHVLATEMGGDGVRMNAVSPGFARTEAMEKVFVQ